MAGQPIIPQGSAPPLAPYSPGTRAGNIIYASGTLAIDVMVQKANAEEERVILVQNWRAKVLAMFSEATS